MTLAARLGGAALEQAARDRLDPAEADAFLARLEQLAFDITASDGIEAIARGRHDRVLVDRDRFVAKLAEKARLVPR